MAFGPIMKFKVGDTSVEMAPLTREAMSEFVDIKHGGGMQRYGVIRFLPRNSALVLEDEQEWYDIIRADKSQIIWGVWVIEGENRILIGNTAIRELGTDDSGYIRRAETGSLIFRPEYWGKGIGTAMDKARTWYAFQQLGVHRIRSAVIKGNRGSSKALSRSGYYGTYTERNSNFIDGKMHHTRHYECLNPNDIFWSQWWGEDEPTQEASEARQITREAMSWVEKNVELV